MAARHEPPSSRRGGDSRRDRSGESRRRGGPRHSVARTDPLYWARARAAETEAADDPFGRPPADPEAATEELPSVAPDWSGRLPLPLPPGLARPPAWSADDRRGVEDATTDSLPVVLPAAAPRPDDAATTVDLPAVASVDAAGEAETVDYRDHPLALVPRSGREVEPRRPESSTLARRGYTGRHRPPETAAPARLGLSTVGMTVAVGVLGVTLAMLHAQPSDRTDSAPPLAAVSPTGTTASGATPGVDDTPSAGPPSTPEQARPRTPRPSTGGPGADTAPDSDRPGTPAVAPDAPAGGGQNAGDDGEEPEARNTPGRPSRPTRTSRPGTASRPTPRCAAPQIAGSGTAAARALAADTTADATADATAQADPTADPDESAEPAPEEPTDEPSPSAPAAGCR